MKPPGHLGAELGIGKLEFIEAGILLVIRDSHGTNRVPDSNGGDAIDRHQVGVLENVACKQFPGVGQGFRRAREKVRFGLAGRAIAVPRLLAAAIGELFVPGDMPTQKSLRHDETGKSPSRVRAATETHYANVRPGFVIAGNESVPAYHPGDNSRSEHAAYDPCDCVTRIADAVNVFGNLHDTVAALLLFLLALQSQ